DVHGPMAERDVRGSHCDHGAEDQRIKDKQIAPDMVLEVVVVSRSGGRCQAGCCLRVHRRHFALLHNKYRTGKRKIQTRSTKCQNRPEISMRLVKRSGSVFHIFEPGPHKKPITKAPPMTCNACSPVSVK